MEVATWLRSGRRQQLEPVFQGNAIDGHHCKRLAAVPALRWGTGRDAYHRAMANTLARFEGFAAKYLDYRAHPCGNESELARSRCRLLNDAVPAADGFETRRQVEDRRDTRSDDLAIFLSLADE